MACLISFISKVFSLLKVRLPTILVGSIELPVNKWDWNDNYNGNSILSLQSKKLTIVPQINIIWYSSSQDSSFGSIMLK